MSTWEYKRTVLRQNEVSEFIHGTKGEKYSALLPLFGLHKMEVAAENCRKLARTVQVESELIEKKNKLKQVDNRRQSIKMNLNTPELKTWREGNANINSFNYLAHIDLNTLRQSCTNGDLIDIENRVLPLVTNATLDSQDAPADVQTLTHNKEQLEVAKSVITAKDLEHEITCIDALVALIDSLEHGTRAEIRQQSQKVIEDISGDIESMWTTLHPGEKIDSIRLALPPTDKAIDVVLKFHGKAQESPRLTLSEGYRNSLGLCIFLAMSK